MAISVVSYTESGAWTTSGATKTASSVSWQAGDIIVCLAGAENASSVPLPTATGLSFATIDANTAAGTCNCRSSYAIASSSDTQNVSCTFGAAVQGGLSVWVIRGDSPTIGDHKEQHTSTKTVASTVTSPGSIYLWACLDWAGDGVGAGTPSPTTTRENSAGAADFLVCDLTNVAVSQSYGETGGGSTGPFSLLVVEIVDGNPPAFPVVEAVAESANPTTAATSHTVSYPAGITSGDLLVHIADKGSTAATVDADAAWTELLDENSANGLFIAWHKCDGTESGTFTVTTSASTRLASIVYRISGAADPATTPPEIASTGSGTSGTPDPPSISPPSSKDYLFIAFYGAAGEEADDDTWSDTPPSGYSPTPPRQKACGTVGTNLGGMIAAAERGLTTGSAENPGTFAKDVSAAWRSQTILVHPAPSGGTPHTETPADNVSATDARKLGQGKKLSEAPTAHDVFARTATFHRTQADGSTATDALKFTRTLKIADNVSAADSATPTHGRALSQQIDDNVTATGEPSLTWTAARPQGDAVTAADSESHSRAIARTIAEDVSAADDATPDLTSGGTSHPVTIDDNVSASDLESHSRALARTLSDDASAADAEARTLDVARTIADDATATDDFSRTADFLRSVAEDVTAADEATPFVFQEGTHHDVPIDDAVSVTDTGSVAWNADRSSGDTVSATDAIGLPRSASVSDDATAHDVLTRTVAYLRSITDSVSADDNLSTGATSSHIVTIDDDVSAADATRKARGHLIADSIAASDQFARAVTAQRSVADHLAVSDALARALEYLRPLADSVSAEDVASTLKIGPHDKHVAVDDGVLVLETFHRTNPHPAVLAAIKRGHISGGEAGKVARESSGILVPENGERGRIAGGKGGRLVTADAGAVVES